MSLLDGVGHIGWWGLSPSQDLTTYCKHNKGDTPLRILCVGTNDLRHVLEMVGLYLLDYIHYSDFYCFLYLGLGEEKSSGKR